MNLFKKYKRTIAQGNTSNQAHLPLFQRVQHLWVKAMEYLTKNKSKRRLMLLLAGFVMLSAAMCGSLIGKALWSTQKTAASTAVLNGFHLPGDGFSFGDALGHRPQVIKGPEQDQVHQLRKLLDSLNHSITGKSAAETIINQYQWLIDSLRIIENFPNQHKHANQTTHPQTTPAP